MVVKSFLLIVHDLDEDMAHLLSEALPFIRELILIIEQGRPKYRLFDSFKRLNLLATSYY
jgi:hypothetical protein